MTKQERIAAKWVERIGGGFHPDTRGVNYINRDGSAAFTPEQVAEYDADMEALCDGPRCQYEVSIEAMEKQGII